MKFDDIKVGDHMMTPVCGTDDEVVIDGKDENLRLLHYTEVDGTHGGWRQAWQFDPMYKEVEA